MGAGTALQRTAGKNTMAWKLVVTGSGVAAGLVTKKVVGRAWHSATGAQPPANPEDPDTTWAEAVAWAMLTGAIAAVVKLVVTRKAAATWRTATGVLPPGIARSAG